MTYKLRLALWYVLASGQMLFALPEHHTELSETFYLGGVQVNEPDDQKWVTSLKHHGMNTVSVTVYAKQGEWDTDQFWFQEVDQGLVSEIRRAKASGLKVVLIPRIALDSAYSRNYGLWHGMIMPRSDESLRSWFKLYGEFLHQWARVAQEEGVEVFALGSEMKALIHTVVDSKKKVQKEITDFNFWYESFPDRITAAEGDPNKILNLHQDIVKLSESRLAWGQQVYHQGLPEQESIQEVQRRRALLGVLWRELIKDLRKDYSGMLTYAANFDNYQNIELWPELDMMGINAYFKLKTELTQEQPEKLSQILVDSWENVFNEIRAFREDQGLKSQPLVFTELGYTFRQNSSVEPWSYEGKSIVKTKLHSHLIDWEEQPENYQERYECLRALQQVVHKPENDFFKGLLYWKLSTVREHENIEAYVIYMAPDSTDPVLDCLRDMVR